jgi:hypothetical protein
MMPPVKKICVAVVFLMCIVSAHKTTKNSSTQDDLPDFEFEDNFSSSKKQQEPASLDFSDFDDFFIDDGSEPNSELDFVSKERALKYAILRALSTRELKYKFSEVLPLLRHLSKTQRMVFSSIISAQINGGRSFTLNEVRSNSINAEIFSSII